MNRVVLKELAKNQIKGNILTLFLCSLVITAISAVTSRIPMLGSSAYGLIFGPVLSYGMVLNYLEIAKGEEATVSRVFDGFKEFTRAWAVNFMSGLFVALWSMLFIIPGIIKAIAYSFAPYILAENPGMTGMEAITRSKEMTYGHKMELFVLNLSFIGWILLGVITFGIGFIYITPYMNATMVNAYHSIKGAEVQDPVVSQQPSIEQPIEQPIEQAEEQEIEQAEEQAMEQETLVQEETTEA